MVGQLVEFKERNRHSLGLVREAFTAGQRARVWLLFWARDVGRPMETARDEQDVTLVEPARLTPQQRTRLAGWLEWERRELAAARVDVAVHPEHTGTAHFIESMETVVLRLEEALAAPPEPLEPGDALPRDIACWPWEAVETARLYAEGQLATLRHDDTKRPIPPAIMRQAMANVAVLQAIAQQLAQPAPPIADVPFALTAETTIQRKPVQGDLF